MGAFGQKIPQLFLKTCLILALLSMSVAHASTPIAVGDLPAAVVSAVNAAAPGATIVSASQVLDKTGAVMGYQVQAQAQNTSYQFAVTVNGTILSGGASSHTTIQPSDLPPAVVAAVNAAAPGATITQAQENNNKGVVTYSVQAQTATSKYGFEVDASGNILQTFLQTTVNVANLPQAVVNAVNAAAPGATITSAQQISGPKQTGYNVFAQDATSQYEFGVTADGTIMFSWQQTPIDPSTLPQNVIDAVMTASSGGTIQKAVMMIKNGSTFYLVQVLNGSTTTTVIVDSNGIIQKSVYTQQDIAISDLPAAVSAAALAAVPGGTIVKAQLTSNGTNTVYLVGMTSGSKMIGLAIDSSGKVLKTWTAPAPSSTNPNAVHSVDVTALPQVVVDAVNKAVPGGTIISAMQGTSKGTTLYKIDAVTADNKDVTLIVDQNGNVGSMRTRQLKTKH
jgi:uncharacterized membrane protein YkoI